MTSGTGSHGAAHFQRLYDASADPWGFRSSAREAEKCDRTMAAPEGRRFRYGFEAGCFIAAAPLLAVTTVARQERYRVDMLAPAGKDRAYGRGSHLRRALASGARQ